MTISTVLSWGRFFSVSPATRSKPDAPRPQLEPAKTPPPKPGWGLPILLVVLGAVAGFVIWNARSTLPSPVQTGGAATVPTARATIGVFKKTLRIGGTVGAEKFAAIRTPRMRGSRDTGRRNYTLTYMADGGTTVSAGEVVAEFEMRWLEDHIDDRKSDVVQAQSDVEKRRAEIMIERETQQQALNAAEAEWEKAKLDLRTAEVRSEIEANLLKLAVQETEATAKQLTEEVKLQEISHQAEIRSLELNVGSEQNHLDRHLRDLERMKLTTPVGGLVVIETIYRGGGQFGQVQEGDEVNPGTFFLRVVDLSKMVLTAIVNQVDVQSVRLGQKCEVRLDAYPDLVLPGHVASLGALATSGGNARFRRSARDDYVKVVSVEVAIDQQDKRVIPDLSASADIILEQQENTLLVPRSAIHEKDGATVVYLRSGDQFLERVLETGEMNNIEAVIVNGLSAGDEVALRTPPAELVSAS